MKTVPKGTDFLCLLFSN